MGADLLKDNNCGRMNILWTQVSFQTAQSTASHSIHFTLSWAVFRMFHICSVSNDRYRMTKNTRSISGVRKWWLKFPKLFHRFPGAASLPGVTPTVVFQVLLWRSFCVTWTYVVTFYSPNHFLNISFINPLLQLAGWVAYNQQVRSSTCFESNLRAC